MALKYNPLLKIGLETTGGDSSEIEAQIAALQNSIDSLQSSLNTLQSNLNTLKNSKITKVTASEQLSGLSVGEIFEWQAATTETFTQGYFYKVVSSGVYLRVDLQPNYTLPIAAANSLGGVKVGSGLNIDETGVLSITGGDSLKVPRCSTQAQVNALTDNDIFQWQGETTADYTQGFFYKKTSNTTVEVVAGDYYVKVSSSHERTLGNYSIKQGYYTFVENKTTPWVGYCQSYNPSVSSYRYFTNYPAVVGQKVAKCSNGDLSSLQLVEWVTVASIDENGKPATFSDGAVYNQYAASTGNVGNLAIFQAVDGTTIGVGIALQNNLNVVGMIFAIDNGVWYPVNFYCSLIKTQAATDITETTILTAQTDTQPQPAAATTSADGLMSARDKSLLNLLSAFTTVTIEGATPVNTNVTNLSVSGKKLGNSFLLLTIQFNLTNAITQGVGLFDFNATSIPLNQFILFRVSSSNYSNTSVKAFISSPSSGKIRVYSAEAYVANIELVSTVLLAIS